jgi:hypothetical protein
MLLHLQITYLTIPNYLNYSKYNYTLSMYFL